MHKVLHSRRTVNWDSKLLADLPLELKKVWIQISSLELDEVPDYCGFREALFKLYYKKDDFDLKINK